MIRRVLILVVLGCCSCGGGGTAPEPAAPAPARQLAPAPAPADAPAGPVKLSFRVHAKDGESVRAIAPGETLRSGDKIALSLDLEQKAHLYVVQFFADGTAAVLFPQGDDENRLSGVTRIPARGWFQLDANTGEENVYVVASVRPLQEAEQTVMKTLNDVRVSGAAQSKGATPKTSEPPIATTTKSGGSESKPIKSKSKTPTKPRKRPKKPRKRPSSHKNPPTLLASGIATRGLQRVSDEGDSIEATTDSAGIAIVRFHFQHR